MNKKNKILAKKGSSGFRFINFERRLVNVIIILYKTIGLLYGFDDGQPFLKNKVKGNGDDTNKQDI